MKAAGAAEPGGRVKTRSGKHLNANTDSLARRSSAEYIESMADLFQRGGKRCHRALRKKLQKTWRWLVGTAVAMSSLGTSITERASDVAAQDDEADIERQLRHYIRANPGAGDTAIGIVSFWLCLQPTPQTIDTIERVLVRLEAEGLVRSRDLAGTTYWFAAGNP